MRRRGASKLVPRLELSNLEYAVSLPVERRIPNCMQPCAPRLHPCASQADGKGELGKISAAQRASIMSKLAKNANMDVPDDTRMAANTVGLVSRARWPNTAYT